MEYIMAFDIGGTTIKYGVLNSDYEIVEKGNFKTPYEGVDYLINKMSQLAKKMENKFPIKGLAVSLPGGVEPGEDGIVIRGGKLRYLHKVPLGKLLREKTGLLTILENDGRCCLRGEFAVGALKGCRNGAAIVLGTSVGGGMIVNGNVLKGNGDFAGKFAHILTTYDLEKNEYHIFGKENGNRSLQQMILREKGMDENQELDGRVVFRWLKEGDPDTVRGFEEFCRKLAVQITNLQVIFDPEIIVIGGGISAQPLLLKYVNQELKKIQDVYPMPRPKSNVVLSIRGNDANLIGAVSVWEKRYDGTSQA